MSKRRGKRLHYGYIVAFVGLLVMLGAQGLGRYGYTMVLPSMREGLALTYSQAGLLAAGAAGGYLASSLVSGLLAARYGPRAVIAVSTMLAGVAMALVGLSPNFGFALAMQIAMGAATAGGAIPVMALMSAWFVVRQRGMAAGIVAGGGGLGFVVTGLLIPPILALYGLLGWRYAWGYMGATVFALGVVGAVVLRNRPEEKGYTAVGSRGGNPAARVGEPAKASMAPLGVYRQRVLWHLASLAFVSGFSQVSYTTFFAAYLTSERGLSAAAAGGLWGLAGLLAMASGFIWGAISDRWGRKEALAAVFVLQGLAFLIFALTDALLGFYLSAILFGLTSRSTMTISAAASSEYVGIVLAPAAFGMTATMAALGLMVGPGIAGYLADLTGTFSTAFIASTITSLAGVGLALTLKPPRTRL